MAESTKSLAENIKPKLIGFIIFEVLVLGICTYVKFPKFWVIQYGVFVFIGFLVFILLDLPAMAESKGGGIVKNLAITYIFMSVMYSGITWGLPQFDFNIELEQINKPPLKLGNVAGPELIAAGKDVFDTYKCWNCHKVWEEGSSDRGPNLGVHQIGLYSAEYIEEQIVDPRKQQAPGFEDEKSVKAMPDYFGEDIEEDEMKALLAFLGSLKSDKRIPVEGKKGEQWTWWDDPKIIAEGKEVYEGIKYPEVNCSVCHGKDGTPAMTGAFDFRNENLTDEGRLTAEPEMLARMTKKPFKDWTDEIHADRVFNGIEGSPMAGWAAMIPKQDLWKAMAYERAFAWPLDKRKANTNPAGSPNQPKTRKYDVPPPDFH